MKTTFGVAAILLTLAAGPAQAAEWRVGVGVFMFDGLDLKLSVRPEDSHWEYGLRALHYTETFETVSGIVTETTTTMVGPQLNYLFTPRDRGSWYLGVSVLYWSLEEKSVRTGMSDKDRAWAPFFGGGYTSKLADSFYWNIGFFFSPRELSASTVDGSTETTGADVQLQIGFSF